MEFEMNLRGKKFFALNYERTKMLIECNHNYLKHITHTHTHTSYFIHPPRVLVKFRRFFLYERAYVLCNVRISAIRN